MWYCFFIFERLRNLTNALDLISLPEGGGAQAGLGQSFTPNAFTGTGNFSLPIALPEGRNGLTPALTLNYSSGSGNGPFGLGWALDVPAILRKTSRGVPTYTDSDVFVLAGASDDLVLVEELAGGERRFRPRKEGAFAEILQRRTAMESIWTVRTRDGHTSIYGTPEQAATTGDPAEADPLRRIYAWHLSETVDPFGNRVRYDYRRDITTADDQIGTQTYLDAVHYVSTPEDPESPFLLTVRLNYDMRPDPFSMGRAGFDLRTGLRCRGIDVVLNGVGGGPVRRYDFSYLDELVAAGERSPEALPQNGTSLLARVRVTGRAAAGAGEDEALPSLDLAYSEFRPERRRFRKVMGDTLPSTSLADPDLDLVDLNGNGLPDFFETRGVPRYWENLGNGHFAPPRRMERAPSGLSLSTAGVTALDIDGDGRTEVMVSGAAFTGFYRLTAEGRFDRDGFVPLPVRPSFDTQGPGVALFDLDGDGATDAVMSRDDMLCAFADPETGWDRVERHPKGVSGGFPDVNFGDPRVRTADMSGDGMDDIVLMHDRNVEYWPNLGHGRWGARRVMRNAPALPSGYRPEQVILGDLDGDGQADLVFIGHDRIFACFNQSGNRWSDPIEILGTPLPSQVTDVRIVDLQGSGVPGILWSDAAQDRFADFWFLDLAGDRKPYLLNRIDNNSGTVTEIDYRSSCEDYLRDRPRRDTRWRTSLPIPVQVVAEVRVTDHFSSNQLVTSFAYRHGQYDGAEREYVGFARVETVDDEIGFDALDAGPFAMDNAAARAPPNRLVRWFELGPVGPGAGEWEVFDASAEFWPHDPKGFSILSEAEAAAISALPLRRSRRDALRTLRGTMLREELYSLDASDREDRPYLVRETLRGVEPVEGRDDVHFAFDVAARETRWDRGDDPLTTIEAWGDYDHAGQPRRRIAIGCPRGWSGFADLAENALATLSVTRFAQPMADAPRILDRPAETQTFELVDPHGTVEQLITDALGDLVARRLVGHARRYYDGDAFEGLPLGTVGPFGAEVRTERLAVTSGQVDAALTGAPDPGAPPYLDLAAADPWPADYPEAFRSITGDDASYRVELISEGAAYWSQETRAAFDFQDGGLVRGLRTRMMDARGHVTRIAYDAPGLFPETITGATGLQTQLVHDYRAMQPSRIEDPNGATVTYRYTPLGLLAAVIRRGREGEGDTEDAPSQRFEYDLLAFEQSPPGARRPISATAIQREHHASGPVASGADPNRELRSVAYSDGFGRLLQTRARAEGQSFAADVFGEDNGLPPGIDSSPGAAILVETTDRVRVTAAVRYDSKGRVIQRFEPYFADGLGWVPPGLEVQRHRSDFFFDPIGRVLRHRAADGTERWTVPGIPNALDQPGSFSPTPWEAYTYDPNDLAPVSVSPIDGTLLTDAAPADHAFTPEAIEIDALGRTIRTVLHQGPSPDQRIITTTRYDIRGNVVAITDPFGRDAFRYQYDFLDRVMRMDSIDAGTVVTFHDAAGTPIETRDARGARTLSAFDALARPVTHWGRDRADLPMVTREHLIWGDTAQVLPQDEARDRYLLGRLFQHYDGAGRVTVGAADFRGNVTESVREVFSDGFAGTLLDTSLEDVQVDWPGAPGAVLDALAAERLSPELYVTSAAFDALDRPIRVDHPIDVAGQRHRTEPRYAASGALEGLLLDGAPIVRRITYDAAGRRRAVHHGNGVLTRYNYDPRSRRLLRLCSHRVTEAGATLTPVGSPMQDFGYAYDLAGNLTTLTDVTPESGFPNNPDAASADDSALAQLLVSGNALVRRFTYDPLYRLTTATGREQDRPSDAQLWDDTPRGTDFTLARGYREIYRYDDLGNLAELTHIAGPGGSFTRRFLPAAEPVAAADNRLTAIEQGTETIPYTHDATGNLVSEDLSRSYHWNHAGQLKGFRVQAGQGAPSQLALYLYGADGSRIKKVVRRQSGQTRSVTTLGGLERTREGAVESDVLDMVDGDTRIASFRFGPPLPGDTTPARKFYLTDHLGSANVVLDDAAGFIDREEFLPYGQTSFGSYGRKRWRFTGRYRDDESGLQRHGARYYAPSQCRFVSVDPLAAQNRLNSPYSYADASPMRFIDPTGLMAEEEKKEELEGLSGKKGRSTVRAGGVDRDRKTINFYVANTKGGLGYEAATKADVWIIQTDGGIKEVGKQINDALGQAGKRFGGEFTVGNLIIDEHGGYWRDRDDPSIWVGGRKYKNPGTSVGSQASVEFWRRKLSPISDNFSKYSTVVFTACNLAGGEAAGDTHSIGHIFLDDLADALGVTLHANRSWSGLGAYEFNVQYPDDREYLSWQDLRDDADYLKDYQDRTNAYLWAGQWAEATPGTGMNVRQTNSVYLTASGGFGIAGHFAQMMIRANIEAQLVSIQLELAKNGGP